ncbi:quinone oxidoreductase family protein [Nocardia sp. NBC_01327]|uniref:quinone oxidoreductase family protein n=1 Tax=Nocardia sp. NBC_01327 TaxID=2903593 RepID=UPI002E1475CD|nr:zinc-binding alcohol dehydrogenase family protein [Nocardia sp. NBC_01327]
MRALTFDRIGTLDALALGTVPDPEPAAGEVLVRIVAAGVNPSDVKNVLGRFPYTTVPRVPGRDFAGVVVAGPDELVGREVWGSGKGLGFTRDGTHAEMLALPAGGVALKPETLTFEQAASCGTPYLTAFEAIERGGVTAGTTLLLIGLGAVGSAALDIARGRGADVIVGVRRPELAEKLRGEGIETVLLDDPGRLAATVHARRPEGAEVVFETTGHWLPAVVPVLAVGGRVCIIAAPADGHVRVPVLDLYRRGAVIIGVNSLLHDVVASAASLEKLRVTFDSGELPAPDPAVLRPLEEAVRVYHDLNGGASAKYVLVNQN